MPTRIAASDKRNETTVKRIALGELEVSAQGLGCMGMSGFYGHSDWDESVATIHHALDLGVTFIDTADIYGAGHNEVLVGRAIHGRREQVQLATKFGIDRTAGDDARVLRGDPAYVRRCCETSLLRLGVDVIDLYYMHRPPQDVPIEETAGAMAELVKAGKVRHLGLSEVDNELLRRAYSVHPIVAVQSEYSLWTRDPETAVLPAMKDLGVALVPFSPLGRGFLTGSVSRDSLDERDARNRNPRFNAEAMRSNQRIVEAIGEVAAEKGVTPAQIALAWVHGQTDRLGLPVVPIPGTKRAKWLDQNVGALEVTLDPSDLDRLDPLHEEVVGTRY